LARQRGVQAAYPRSRLVRGAFKDDPVGERVRQSFHPGPCGEVTVVPKPYYLITEKLTGTLHGTPHAYDTHVPLLVYGAGWAARVRKDAVTPQAAVVILAHALGIKPPSGAKAALPEGVMKRQGDKVTGSGR